MNIPKLRFPEFKDEWKKKKLGEITFKTDKKNKSKELLPVYSISNKFGFIPQATQFEGMDSIERGYDTTLYKIIENNTFAYNPARINVGSIGYNENFGRLIVSSLYVCFKTTEVVDDKFLNHFFDTNKFNNYVLSHGEGGVRIYLFYENFSLIPFYLPSLPEQKRIASFFTVLDKKIAELKQKKSLLEQYKRGVMQKIYSQKIRFKEHNGKDFPKWEKLKLSDVSIISMGQSPESKAYNNEGNGMPLIQGNADIQNRKSNPRNWTTHITKECSIGDLLLTVRAPVGSVAKSIHNACIGRGVCSIRNNAKSNIEFLYQFLLDYELQWGRLEQGSTFTAISGSDIKSIGIQLPSLEEQSKIANFLSSIDEKINLTENQIQQTLLYKKGILQKMYI